jgi:putative membrane protein
MGLVSGDNKIDKTLALRSLMGGALMGLANLVPGISGGTMLLAAGVYPDFINAIAESTRLRIRVRNLLVLGCVVGAALIGILLFAGGVKDLVVNHRWVMYSLFIGLTLGGVPVVKKLAGPQPRREFWIASVLGFFAMALLALAQQSGWGQGQGAEAGFALMFLAGIAGASAMILPGVSGGYLLLVLGAYIPILSGIEALKDGLKGMDVQAIMGPLIGVVLPVGLGVVLGVAGVSNILKVALDRHEQATLGSLLGLLVGAVVGLWPFQQAVEPVVGLVVKGRALTTATRAQAELEDLPTEFFSPELSQVGLAGLTIALGLAITYGVSWVGDSSEGDQPKIAGA